MVRTLFLLIIIVTSVHSTVLGQSNLFHLSQSKFQMADAGTKPMVRRSFLPGLKPDRSRIYKQRSPGFSMPVNTTALLGENYWMGSVTQQSYNGGKVGRYYYWDVQGNLRGSYLFVDIAGKNKRGLKLVFPRHRSLF